MTHLFTPVEEVPVIADRMSTDERNVTWIFLVAVTVLAAAVSTVYGHWWLAFPCAWVGGMLTWRLVMHYRVAHSRRTGVTH
jgi:Flp pilus assembly protein TadB